MVKRGPTYHIGRHTTGLLMEHVWNSYGFTFMTITYHICIIHTWMVFGSMIWDNSAKIIVNLTQEDLSLVNSFVYHYYMDLQYHLIMGYDQFIWLSFLFRCYVYLCMPFLCHLCHHITLFCQFIAKIGICCTILCVTTSPHFLQFLPKLVYVVTHFISLYVLFEMLVFINTSKLLLPLISLLIAAGAIYAGDAYVNSPGPTDY